MLIRKTTRIALPLVTLTIATLLTVACGGSAEPGSVPATTVSSPAAAPATQRADIQPAPQPTQRPVVASSQSPQEAQALAAPAPTSAVPASAMTVNAMQPANGASMPAVQPMAMPAPTAVGAGLPPEAGGTANPNDAPLPLMYFDHYGVNPFIDADEDALSTFALDGDTASYAILRQYLRSGSIAPPDSVRVEEYVNSLPQNYPATEDPLGLHLDAGPSPFGEPGYVLLRVGVSNPAPTEERDPVSLIFVVDVSGSMSSDNRLGLAKSIMVDIADRTINGDRIAIVTYADQVMTRLPFTNADNIDDVVAMVRQLRPGGSTYAEAGLTHAYRLAANEMDRGRKVRLVLLSDGVANVGATGPESILKVVDDHAQRNATLTTIGVGISGNYNDVLMEVLANRGNGTYHYVSDQNAADEFLWQSGPGIFTESARDARIQVEFNPTAVRKYRLIGYENRAVADEDFRDDSLDFGEVGFAKDVSALYELRLFDDLDAGATIAQARLRWLDPQSRQPTELEQSIDYGDIADGIGDTDPYFRQAAAVAEFAELLRNSYYAQCNDLDSVAALLDSVQTELEENRSYHDLRDLVNQAGYYFEPYCKP